ncbi:maleylpyruvate isomerase family mycothiol-dependent enzyme [Gandjariella thermophila]|nr:maleylpyruvate isomerase family mycothiol-dependent enzyme [Gandjariella thermophila]
MRALIDYGRLLDVLGVQGELLADSARDVQPDLPVPGCPGLTTGETVRHVASVYRMVLGWLRDGRRPRQWQRAPNRDEDPADFLRSGLRALIDELAAHDPGEPCPTWWPEDTSYGFWYRRMAHETTVHRVDVQAAAGEGAVHPVPEDVAEDGVDEVLTLWFGHRLTVLGVSGSRRGQVAVRTGDRVWMTRVGPVGTAAWRSAAATSVADAEVTGAPADVYLWLWGRRPVHQVRSSGDPDAVAQLWALLRLATR